MIRSTLILRLSDQPWHEGRRTFMLNMRKELNSFAKNLGFYSLYLRNIKGLHHQFEIGIFLECVAKCLVPLFMKFMSRSLVMQRRR